MSRSGKVIDLAKANPLGRLIQSAMSAAASAFGVALIAEPCYAVAALAESATSCGGWWIQVTAKEENTWQIPFWSPVRRAASAR